jgi:phosphoribosylanthranilate isomerase
MWIKICGMTTAAAVAAAIKARVDAIGFVFAPSVRQITPVLAAQLAAPARGRLSCIAVTHHPSQQLIDEILSVFNPDALQTDIEDLSALRLPRRLVLLPVLRANQPVPVHFPERLLLEGATSGTGVTFDWSDAQQIARETDLVLAGGLNEQNVASAISTVRPFGVDVSSGVEERPGLKSPEKIAEFANAARAAFERVHEEYTT